MKDRILEKAGEMFLNLGFKSVTMDDIAKELAISKKTVYKYFSNKSALVNQAVSLIQDEFEAKLLGVKDKKFNAIKEEFEIKVVLNEMLKNAKESPMYQLKKYYTQTYVGLMKRQKEIFHDCNSDNLKKGISEGLYREGIDVNTAVNFYFVLIFGAYDGDLSTRNMKDIFEMEYKVIEYHIRAIATEIGIKELEKQLKGINKK